MGSADNKTYAINADGTLKWNFTTGGRVASSPAIGANGTIYVGSHDNKLYALSLSNCPLSADYSGFSACGRRFNCTQQQCESQDGGGALKWSFKTGGDINSSPAISADGTIYV
ncbi:MAG: PQQ-binding-like beta-propeller repeat protein, partial [bacterium]